MKLQQYFEQFKAELAAASENRENIISEQGREIIYANVPDAIALMNEI